MDILTAENVVALILGVLSSGLYEAIVSSSNELQNYLKEKSDIGDCLKIKEEVFEEIIWNKMTLEEFDEIGGIKQVRDFFDLGITEDLMKKLYLFNFVGDKNSDNKESIRDYFCQLYIQHAEIKNNTNAASVALIKLFDVFDECCQKFLDTAIWEEEKLSAHEIQSKRRFREVSEKLEKLDLVLAEIRLLKQMSCFAQSQHLSPTLNKPFMAQEEDEDFVPRRELEPLIRNLLEGSGDGKVAITTALRGAGGYGKTTLAKAVCRDQRIKDKFPDGILWVTLGETPGNLIGYIEDLIYNLSYERPGFTTLDSAKARLMELLDDRCILIVIDDVWNEVHLKPFLQGGAKCARLITTRDDATLPLSTVKIPVDAMQRSEAVELLGFGLTFEKDEALYKLAERLGNWPLLLKLVNATLRLRVYGSNENIDQALGYINEALTEEGLTAFDMENPLSRDQAVDATLNVSIRVLNESERGLYSELSIFPEDVRIPLEVLEKLWNKTGNIKPYHVKNLCGKLYRMSLLHTYNARSGYIIVHDVIRSYLISKHKNKLPEIHSQFLDNFKIEKWTDLSKNEPYLWINLAYHLYESMRIKELRDLLLNFGWLQSKLEVTSFSSSINDYNFFPQDSTLQLIKDALQLSASALIMDKKQLASQLLGRLKSFQNDEIQSFLVEIIAVDKQILKLLPIAGTLDPPGGPLVSTFTGHSAGIKDVTVTQDGNYIISASDDRKIKVWEFNTWKEVRLLEGHSSEVSTVAVTPNEEYLVSVSSDNTLKIWNFKSGILIKTLKGYSGANTLAVTPNSKYVVAASNDRTLTVLDLKTREEIKRLKLHSTRVGAVAIAFEGKLAVSASYDSTIIVWDIESYEIIRKINAHSARIRSLATTPDEKYIVSASDDQKIKVFGFKTEKEIRILKGHSSTVREVAVTPDSKYVISASDDCEIKVWDIETGEEIKHFEGHSSPVKAIAVTTDGEYLISGSSDGTLKIWKIKNKHEIQSTKGHSGGVSVVVITPDNKYAISASYDKTLKIWEIESGKEIGTLEGHSAGINSIAVTPESKYIVSASYDSTIKIWEIESRRFIHTLEGHSEGINSVVITTDGRYIISASDDSTLKIWEIGSWREIHTLEGHSSKINSVAVMPDCKYIVSASTDSKLKVWEIESGKEITTLEGHSARINSVVVTQDGRYVISASDDQTLKVWEAGSWKEVHTLMGFSGWVNSVAVTSDSRYIISASDNHVLKVLEIETWKVHTLDGHLLEITGIVAYPGGKYTVSVSKDRTLILWEVQSGKKLTCFSGDNPLTSSCISSDGRTIVVGEASGSVHILRITGLL